jgi:hypothetical protein
MKNLFLLLVAVSIFSIGNLFSQPAKIVLEENFDNNSNDWDIINEPTYSSKIESGTFNLSSTDVEWRIWDNIAYYDLFEAFTIEAKIKIIESTDGIIFYAVSSEDLSDIYGIQLWGSAASPYKVKKFETESEGIYAEGTEDDSFAQGKDLVLKVKCKVFDEGVTYRRQLTYYVNDIVIGVEESASFEGNWQNLAFVLSPGTKVEVDYVKVFGTAVAGPAKVDMYVATTPLSKTTPPQALDVTIKAGEPIYAMIYMSQTFHEIVGANQSVNVTEYVWIDGGIVSRYDYKMDFNEVQTLGNTYSLEMAPAIDKINYPRQASTLCKPLFDLEPGIHEITIGMQYSTGSSTDNCGQVTFKFDNRDAAGRAKFEEMYNKYSNKILTNVTLPTAMKTDAKLDASIKQAIIDEGWSQSVVKVVIMDSDWSIATHEYTGAILYRWINTCVAVKSVDGTCMLFYPIICQDYAGGGVYSTKTTLCGMHLIEKQIACENIK